MSLKRNIYLKSKSDENYQLEVFNEYRTREIFSLFGFIICGYQFSNNLKWTGTLFGYVNIKEKKIRERYLKFDDGYTYMNYWMDWKNRWIIVEIVK